MKSARLIAVCKVNENGDGYITSLDFHRWEKSRITDVHEFFIRNKDGEWFENGRKTGENANDNVAVVHTTSPRAFQRSRGYVTLYKDVKPRGLDRFNVEPLVVVAGSLNT